MTAAITAAVDGPLFLRVNESPAEFADDSGGFTVHLSPER